MQKHGGVKAFVRASGTEDVCKMIAQSSRKGNLPARDAVAYMAVRTNRRIIANAQTCVADIKSGKVTSAEQRTAYFWMILQPFLSIDDFGMAMLSENQRKDLVQLSIDALGTIACLSRSLQMDKNMILKAVKVLLSQILQVKHVLLHLN